MVIRRIGVMSAAKITGALYAALGLIAGCILATFSMMSAGFMANAGNSDVPSWIAPIFGIGAIVIFPMVWGLILGLLVSIQKFKPLGLDLQRDRKSTRLNSSHLTQSRMPSSA